MKRNMNQWCNDVLEAPMTFGLPIISFPGLSLTGQTVQEVLKDAEEQYKLLKRLTEEFPALPAIMTNVDLTHEAEAFGCKVELSDDEMPKIKEHVVKDWDTLECLEIPEVEAARVHVFLDTARLLLDNVHHIPIFGLPIGPFSLAGTICEFKQLIVTLKKDPEFVHGVIEKSTQYLINYAKKYKELGANGIVIAEPSAGLISTKQIDEFSSPYIKRIVDAVQDENFIVILHNCGPNAHRQIESMVSTGVKGLSVGNAVEMEVVMPQVPEDFLVFGNIDPTEAFRMGTPELMKERTMDLLEKMKGYKNFVLASGCDLPPGTPIENVKAFYVALAEFNEKNKKCANLA